MLTRKLLPYDHWEFTLNKSNFLRIVPARGGLISSWVCNDQEILYFDEQRFKDSLQSVRGGIPILFPICGSLSSNKCVLQGREYLMNQHGFARNLSWDIKYIEEKKIILLSMSSSKETMLQFPYSFLLEIEVKLTTNALNFKAIVYNFSQEKMPFCFGLHPYFTVSNLEHLSLVGLDNTCLDQNIMKYYSTDNKLVELSRGVDFLAKMSEPIRLIDLLTGRQIEFKYLRSFSNVVVWTDPPRKMICVEPWTSPRNALNTGEELMSVEPGSSKELFCSLIVS